MGPVLSLIIPMRSAPVAADPASPLNCSECRLGLEGVNALHVCPHCGTPQSLRSDEDYFSALGVSRQFALNRAEIEQRFFGISRLLHPDRFSTLGAEKKQASLERMSFLNDAYRTLRDPIALREYRLKLEGIVLPKAAAPAELAEAWFDVQDQMVENPEQGRSALAAFVAQLAEHRRQVDEQIQVAERESDAAPRDHAPLERLARAVQTQSYLLSMGRDVERLKTRIA